MQTLLSMVLPGVQQGPWQENITSTPRECGLAMCPGVPIAAQKPERNSKSQRKTYDSRALQIWNARGTARQISQAAPVSLDARGSLLPCLVTRGDSGRSGNYGHQWGVSCALTGWGLRSKMKVRSRRKSWLFTWLLPCTMTTEAPLRRARCIS